MVPLEHYIAVSGFLFVIGCLGVLLNRQNLIKVLMSLELILLATNINFVTFSAFFQEIMGQVFSLFILTVAAAEAAIGLAILVIYFRNRGTISLEDGASLKG